MTSKTNPKAPSPLRDSKPPREKCPFERDEPSEIATERRTGVRVERFNTLTHGIALLILLCVSWVPLWMGYAKSWEYAFGVTFFTAGMLFMYTASWLYHLWRPGRGKRVMQIIDHIGIYVMIAGSYTPIYMVLVAQGYLIFGWLSFGFIWLIALLGILYKVFLWRRHPRWSLFFYLAMGWSVLPIFRLVWQNLPLAPMLCILGEGISYTAGCYFFANDTDPRHPLYHGVWHLFVFAGTIFHFAAVLLLLN